MLREGLEARLPKLFEELDKLDGKDYIDGWGKVAPYALHKLSSIDLTNEDGTKPKININIVDTKPDNEGS